MNSMVSESDMIHYAREDIMKSTVSCRSGIIHKFKRLFGIPPSVASSVWNQMARDVIPGTTPLHVLWAVFFLKTYCTEPVMEVFFGADRKTIRKHLWYMVTKIAALDMVRIHLLQLREQQI